MQRYTGFILIIIGTLMWSIDTLLRYPLLSQFESSTLVFIEHLILISIFIPVSLVQGFNFKKFTASSWISFFIIGVLGSAIGTIAFTQAFILLNPSLVILLQKLQPLIAISFSAWFLKEKISRRFLLYCFFALLGVFLLSWPDLAPVFSNEITLASSQRAAFLGYGLTLVAVFSWGLSTVFGKYLGLQGFKENEILTGRFSFGFLALLFYCSSRNTLPSAMPPFDVSGKIILMVLLSGLLGMSFYYRGLRKIPAHIGAIAELFFPLSAVTINWIFLGKALLPIQIVGSLVLVGASVILNLRGD